MDFLDKIGNIAKNIGDRTNDAIEITKLNAKIASEKNAVGEDLKKIGEFYYKKFAGGLIADTTIIDEKEFLEKLPTVAELAIGDACTGSNPRIPTQEEMEKLLKACYYDTEIDF